MPSKTQLGLFAFAIILIVLGALILSYPEWFKVDKTNKDVLLGSQIGAVVSILVGLFAGWKGYLHKSSSEGVVSVSE